MRERRHLWAFALFALAIHAALFLGITVEQLTKSPEPQISGRFVKRRPLRQRVLQRSVLATRSSRPLERAVAAPAAYARATMPQASAPSVPRLVLSPSSPALLPRAPMVVGRGVASHGQVRATAMQVAVHNPGQLDLGLELLDTHSLDTGQYQAVVVQNKQDRRALRGFVHLAAVRFGSAIAAATARDPDASELRWVDEGSLWYGDWRHSANIRALVGLAQAIEAQTQLHANVDQNAALDESAWLGVPFILLTSTCEIRPTTAEIANLGRYLTGGGFAYVEVVGRRDSGQAAYGEVADLYSMRELVRGALETQALAEGRDWKFEELPMADPLFHCYYDFEYLPTSFWAVVMAMTANSLGGYVPLSQFGMNRDQEPAYLEGIRLQGRLAVVYSQRNYRDLWSQRLEQVLTESRGTMGMAMRQWVGSRNYTSQAGLRLGVNIVVYALTQDGSLARQYLAAR